METPEERLVKAREIYDHHIMVEMLAHSHVCFIFIVSKKNYLVITFSDYLVITVQNNVMHS